MNEPIEKHCGGCGGTHNINEPCQMAKLECSTPGCENVSPIPYDATMFIHESICGQCGKKGTLFISGEWDWNEFENPNPDFDPNKTHEHWWGGKP